MRVTDREGTHLRYSLDETYWDGTHHGWVPEPRRWYGHLFGHPTPPLPRADAEGVVKGTTSHFSRAFPQLTLHLAEGRIEAVEGGGGYGAAWAELLQETTGTRYPGFPRPGLFHLWEVAIGGHPKVRRPGIEWWSSGGFDLPHVRGHHDRRRGAHAGARRPAGGPRRPAVRRGAERYGDPDALLAEDWIPSIPGITAPGSYEEFAGDPAGYIYGDAGAPSSAR